MSIEVQVYEPDGTTPITVIAARRNPKWQDELNTPGSGQFELHLDSAELAAHPTLLDPRNVVRYTADDGAGPVLFEWVIEGEGANIVSSDEKAGRWTTVSGRGTLSRFELAIVYPEILNQATATEDRAFNFSSLYYTPDGAWVAPVGVRQDADTTARGASVGRYPKPWADGAAQWIWSTDPEANAPLGSNWFRTDSGALVLASAAELLIECSFDNFGELWVDGELAVLGDPIDPYNWKQSYSYSKTFAAGEHAIGAHVRNDGLHAGTDNPGAFLCTVWTVDANGDRDTCILRTDETHWLVKPYGTPPGWTFGDILVRLVTEAQDRGVTDLLGVTLGFDGSVDSNGDAWTDRQDRTLHVGDDLLKVFGIAAEQVCDIWMAPGLVLHAAPRRGSDLHATVSLAPGENILASAPSRKTGALRNNGLVRYGNRWVVVADATSTTAHGRREVGLQVSNAGSAGQASVAGAAAFVESAKPEIAIPVQIHEAVGPQPYLAFGVGDVVEGPDMRSAPISVRTMAVTGSEDAQGYLTYDLDMYPDS